MQFLLLLPEIPRNRGEGSMMGVADNGHLSAAPRRRTSNPVPRYGYQILALCAKTDAAVVADSMRDEFKASDIEVASLGVEISWRALARVRARVRCSNVERSGLVRVTERLNLMSPVRSVLWESIPDPGDERVRKGT